MQTQKVQEEQLLRNDVNAVGWFEIPVRDLEPSKVFYEKVFGVRLENQRMGDYELAMFPWKMDNRGAAGCLAKGPMVEPSGHGTLVYFNVVDIDEVLGRVTQNGGKVLPRRSASASTGSSRSSRMSKATPWACTA